MDDSTEHHQRFEAPHSLGEALSQSCAHLSYAIAQHERTGDTSLLGWAGFGVKVARSVVPAFLRGALAGLRGGDDANGAADDNALPGAREAVSGDPERRAAG